MIRSPVRNKFILSEIGFYPLLAAVAARALPQFYPTPYFWPVIGLMVAFAALFKISISLFHGKLQYSPVYFCLQALLCLVLELYPNPPLDFFAVLFIVLCVQAFWSLAESSAIKWSGLFTFFASAGLIVRFGWFTGLGYVVTYAAAFFFTGLLCSMTLRAEQAQKESQELLVELRSAHQKLQDYSLQVEELAGAQERERLARELHDSVTQTIFSMTLTAQAARILLERDTGRVAVQLDRLQSLSQSALAEMRSLIQQLRPHSIAEDGLAAALRRHVAERKSKDGLEVDLQISGERRLPIETEEALYRVVQEALNNVIKHAHTNQALVRLDLEQDPISLRIEDHGRGFDLATFNRSQSRPAGVTQLGLSGMSERVRALGGSLVIDSKPGLGTSIQVEIRQVEEPEHA